MEVKYKFFGDKENVKSLYENANGNVEKVPHSFKKYEKDFCYDLVATSCKEIHKNVYEYELGLGFQINRDDVINELMSAIMGGGVKLDPKKMEPSFMDNDMVKQMKNAAKVQYQSLYKWFDNNLLIDIDIRPRSSIRDTGLILTNSVGTVDEPYINTVKATFYHVITDLPKYEVGNKVAQMKLGFSFKCSFVEVDEFDETNRGLGGHGSSGK